MTQVFNGGMLLSALICCVALAGTQGDAHDNWPCFRGPNRDGVSNQNGLPLEWTSTKNIVWKTALPGGGASSPITYGNQIFITCFSQHQPNADKEWLSDVTRHLVALDRASGKILWNVAVRSNGLDGKHAGFLALHGYASSTPVADETGVYAFHGAKGIFAYTHAGKLKWSHPFESRGPRADTLDWGYASSPVLFEDVVIVNADIESQELVALDKANGREAWRVALSGKSRSTPLLMKVDKSHELVFHLKGVNEGGSKGGILAAVDPVNGKLLWECQAHDNYLNPSPIAGDGIIYAIAGYPGWAVAIRPGGRGDVTQSHKLWEMKFGSEICTPVFYKGHLYWAHEEQGIAYCVNAKTGNVVYKERLEPRPDRIYASGVMGDGKLYYVSRENGTYVLAAKPEFKLLAHNVIESDDSVCNGTPAISRSQLLLRSDRYLYCIGAKSTVISLLEP